MNINKDKIKKIFIGFVWMLIGAGCITLLASSVHSKDAKRCRGVQIEISGVSNNFFIDKNDVYAIIKNYGGDSTGKKTLGAIDLKKIEKELEKDVWIKNAELFFDNNNFLKVYVQEREPVARIFTVSGNTFYTDSSCMILPLSDKFSARLPVFTGFPSDAKMLSGGDSSLLCDIKNLSLKISADSFVMAMIDQVDITAARSFEMIPKLGKQVIVFGDAGDADAKFAKLELFYKNVITQAGWNRYRIINLEYKDQVVGVVRGKEDVAADSLKTLALIKYIAEDAAKKAADSTQNFIQDNAANWSDSLLIQQSSQRDEGSSGAAEAISFLPPQALPAADHNVLKVAKKPKEKSATPAPKAKLKVTAPAIKKQPIVKPKPKAAKKPENDY